MWNSPCNTSCSRIRPRTPGCARTRATGNIGLLERAEQAGLLPPGVGHAAADAYRTLRQAQHRARLNEEPTRVPPQQLAQERRAVLALWNAVFTARENAPG